MPTFPARPFRSSRTTRTLGARYRSLLARHPFVLFGLPFLATIVAGSFFLTPATAIRYEKHDRKVRRLSEDERLGIHAREGGRRVSAESVAEEYYRLAAKDLDDWEQKRVKRLPGEHDGIL
ncbi:MAG: Cytochrome oxidase assembly [Thelocarpon impressellum]|nr:MAG: Cytochrome oxidase assembly [Thelocarpon impressellum]